MRQKIVRIGLISIGLSFILLLSLCSNNFVFAEDLPTKDITLDFLVDTSRVSSPNFENSLKRLEQIFQSRIDLLAVSGSTMNSFTNETGTHLEIKLSGVKDAEEVRLRLSKQIKLEFKVQNYGVLEEDKINAQKMLAKDFLKKMIISSEGYQRVLSLLQNVTDAPKNLTGVKTSFLDEIEGDEYKKSFQNTKPGNFVNHVEQSTLLDANAAKVRSGFIVYKLEKVEKVLRDFPKAALNFSDIAKKYSDSKTIDLGFIRSTEVRANKEHLKVALQEMQSNQVSDVIESEDGFFIMKELERYDAREEYRNASHILLKTESASVPIVDKIAQTKEEKRIMLKNKSIYKKAQNILALLQKKPNRYIEYAKKYSEESTKNTGGALGFFQRGAMVKPFEDMVFSMNVGQISPIVKTEYGYHIIRLNEIKPKYETWITAQQILVCFQGAKATSCKNSSRTKEDARILATELMRKVKEENSYTYSYTLFSTENDPWKIASVDEKYLTGQHLVSAEAQYQGIFPVVALTFNEEGTKIFEAVTEKYVGERLGIFVDNYLISAPVINEKIVGGKVVISGNFSVRDAALLAQDLTRGVLPMPIVLIK